MRGIAPIHAVVGLVLMVTISSCFSSEQNSQKQPSKYLDAVNEFADNVLKYGRDTYDPKHTPLFVDGLNVHTHEPVKWIDPDGTRWILSNLASQQNLFRTLDGLTKITGDPKYKQAAMDAIRYAFDNLRSPNGLLYWGHGAAYDAEQDGICGFEDLHVLKLHYPYYELMWEIDPKETKRFIEAFWSAHILDWSNLDMDRIALQVGRLEEPWNHEYKRRPTFFKSKRSYAIANILTGSSLLHGGTTLYRLSGKKQPLVWSKRLAQRFVDTRHPNTGISAFMYNTNWYQLGEDMKDHFVDPYTAIFPWDFYEFRYLYYPESTQVHPWISIFLVGKMIGEEGKEFTQWATEELNAWGKVSYRSKDNSFVPMLTDGTNLEGYVWKEGPGCSSGVNVIKPYPADVSFFWAYSLAYAMTGDEFIWEMARNIALGNDFGDIGRTPTCTPELQTNTTSSNVYGLLGFLELYAKTNKPEFLQVAQCIGDNIVNNQFYKGFFIPSERHIYARFDCFEPLALLHLDVAMKSTTINVPSVWPSMPLFVPPYRHKEQGVDRWVIYALTDSLEPSISLQEAAVIGDIELVRRLLDKGVGVDSLDDGYLKTALHRAAIGRHKSVVELLVANGADINARDSSQNTPLYYAARGGHIKIAELLVANGADVNAKNNNGQTPVDIAISRNHKEIVKLLIAKGADVSLHAASRFGDLAIVKSLIEKGACINAKDTQGRTALHYAAEKGHKDVVELLIASGADINAKNSDGRTPVDIAISINSKDIVELLITKGAEVSSIHSAAYLGNVAKVRSFIEQGRDVNAVNQEGKAPLHYAAMVGSEEISDLLLVRGAEINIKDDVGATPLHRAAAGGHSSLAEFLIARGAYIDARDDAWDETPLHWSAYAGSKAVVQLLIAKGANIHAKDNKGYTPLYWTVHAGHRYIAELLIAKGADVNAKGNNGDTVLSVAKEKGHTEIVELLRKHEAKEEEARQEEESPVVPLADINKKAYTHQMPLHKAAAEADLERVKSLIIGGADANAESNEGWTALHRAAVFGHAEVVEFLLNHGADVNKVNRWGWMPLHSAALYGHKDTVELLIANGADIKAKTLTGETALQIAIDRSYTQIADLLRKHGAKE